MEGFFDIFSLTDGTLAPAFLFDGSSVSIRRNGVTLTPDVHYTLTGTIYDTPANTGFQSLTVTFLSGSTIGVGESFSVSKLFYRPVGSVTDFTLGSAARASQFITLVPEPTTLTILAAAGIGMIRRNRHSGGRIARKSS